MTSFKKMIIPAEKFLNDHTELMKEHARMNIQPPFFQRNSLVAVKKCIDEKQKWFIASRKKPPMADPMVFFCDMPSFISSYGVRPGVLSRFKSWLIRHI